jgi:hypothetical protein
VPAYQRTPQRYPAQNAARIESSRKQSTYMSGARQIQASPAYANDGKTSTCNKADKTAKSNAWRAPEFIRYECSNRAQQSCSLHFVYLKI